MKLLGRDSHVDSFFSASNFALFGASTQFGSNSGSDGGRRDERVAPDTENSPPSPAEQAANATVAGAITGYFALPVFAVSKRNAAMPRAAVPEAAVNEDGQSLTPEDEVGTAGERLLAAPAGDAGGAQDGDQLQFGGFIAMRANRGHDLGPLFLCENVGHYPVQGL
jgi:hypothetical protein